MQAPRGPILRNVALAPHAGHFFTAASLRLREDETEWAEVAALAGVPVERLRLLHQVHGRTVAVVSKGSTGEWRRPEADAVVTDDPTVALVVRVADCAPILLADVKTGTVAAIHAGWRSTLHRIVDAAVTTMRTTFGTDPGDLVAAIGPSLGVCCGEMGDEVVDAFREAGHDSATLSRWFTRDPGRRPHFDLWGANRDQLAQAGIPPAAIHVSGLCTRTHSGSFHSVPGRGTRSGTNGRRDPGQPMMLLHV